VTYNSVTSMPVVTQQDILPGRNVLPREPVVSFLPHYDFPSRR